MQAILFNFILSVKMNLRIIKSGLLDTIQDMGRYGWQHLGINPTGCMDKLSAQRANILVGNKPGDAVLELHFPSSELFFEIPVLIAITGADFSVHINGEEIPLSHPVLLSKFSIVQFRKLEKGARAYLAIKGSFNTPVWLDSFSTHIKAATGGFKGRALQKDDDIPLHDMPLLSAKSEGKEFHVLPWKAEMQKDELLPWEVWVLPGNEWSTLTNESKEHFIDQRFIISNQSDRMGYQLKGDPLVSDNKEELISSAVNFGTIQLLPDGQLIILMADHQTTGGYPRIAHVISAHHSKLGQLHAGEIIRFKMTNIATAEELFMKQQQHLLQLQNACSFRLDEFFK